VLQAWHKVYLIFAQSAAFIQLLYILSYKSQAFIKSLETCRGATAEYVDYNFIILALQ